MRRQEDEEEDGAVGVGAGGAGAGAPGPQSLPELFRWPARYARRLLLDVARPGVCDHKPADCLQGFAKLIRHCDFELYEAYSGAGTAGITLKQVVREMTAVVRAASPEVPWPLPCVKTVSACDHNPNCRVFLTSLHEDSRAARQPVFCSTPLKPLKL